MGHTREILEDVRQQLAPDDEALDEARRRRDAALGAGESFGGVRGSLRSRSLAHGTANCPVHHRDKGLDGDGAIVLDRRVHPTLGPDSSTGEGPGRKVKEVRDHLRPKLQVEYPKVSSRSRSVPSSSNFTSRYRRAKTPPLTSWLASSAATHPACGSRTLKPSDGIHRTLRNTPDW